MNDWPGIANWLGRAIGKHGEPWYRFGRILSTLNRYAPVPDGVRWLDLGCQMGQYIKCVQAGRRINATGIDDFEPGDAVEVCRKYLRLEIGSPEDVFDGSWRYLSRKIEKVGFDIEGKFAYISALEILEHMVDTDAFLRECRSHLDDGGHLVISTPNLNSLRNRVQFPFGAYPNGLEYRTIIHHVRLYNAPALVSHLREHRFDLVAMAGVSFLPARFLRYGLVRKVDAHLADWFPSLCGNLIAIFRAA